MRKGELHSDPPHRQVKANRQTASHQLTVPIDLYLLDWRVARPVGGWVPHTSVLRVGTGGQGHKPHPQSQPEGGRWPTEP
jgi:hypothetical protein